MPAPALARMCFSKKRYPSEDFAAQVAQVAADKRGVDLRVYHCPCCSGFHLTHQPEKTRPETLR